MIAKNFEGFYAIPGYSNYGVSIDGRVVNNTDGCFLSGSTNPDGYHNFRLTSDAGFVLTWGRHRLLAYVFLNPGTDIAELVVNHKNGIKGDDRLDNLEWTTYRGNQEHAGANGLTEKCLPISVRCATTGFVWYFPSIIEAARNFGMTKDAIVWRLSCGEARVFPELKQYRYGHSNANWNLPDQTSLQHIQHGRSRAVLVRNILTNELLRYEKASDAANALGVSIASMSIWLNRQNQPVLPGFNQVKWADDASDQWRATTNPYAEVASTTGTRAVKVTDARGVISYFSSAKECADFFGIRTTALSYRLARPDAFFEGFSFGYL